MQTSEETAITKALRDQAERVNHVPDYAAMLADDVIRVEPLTLSRPRLARLVLVAAVAVITVAVSVVSWRGLTASTRQRSAGVPQCSTDGGGAFAAAVRSGVIAAGAQVLSTGPDNSLLVAANRHGVTAAVTLIDAAGHTRSLWRAKVGDRVRAIANPSSAITDDLVSFVLRPSNGSVARVLWTERHTGVTHQLPDDPGYRPATDAALAPFSGAETVEFVVNSTSRAVQRAVLYFVQPSVSQRIVTAQTSRILALVPAGGDTVVIHRQNDGRLAIARSVPSSLPTTLGPAVTGGYAFASDGTTMRWLVSKDGHQYLLQWRPGEPAPISIVVPAGVDARAAVGATFVQGRSTTTGRSVVVNVSNGSAVALPAGFNVFHADPSTVVLADQHGSTTRFITVPTATLFNCGPLDTNAAEETR